MSSQMMRQVTEPDGGALMQANKAAKRKAIDSIDISLPKRQSHKPNIPSRIDNNTDEEHIVDIECESKRAGDPPSTSIGKRSGGDTIRLLTSDMGVLEFGKSVKVWTTS